MELIKVRIMSKVIAFVTKKINKLISMMQIITICKLVITWPMVAKLI